MKEVFLALVRLGIGNAATITLPDRIEWNEVEFLAKNQGLFAVMFDGTEKLPSSLHPPLTTWLRWIGEVQLEEARYHQQCEEACKMALLFHRNGIRTYVLKGNVVSECYPKPEHRVSSDVDCFLLPEEGNADVWEKGNKLMEEAGNKVGRGFYKNSSFNLPGLTVENHRYLVPFRGNKTLQRLEQYLQRELKEGSRSSNGSRGSRFEGTELWRPPVMVSALFLIEHAYSHFLHEGLTWRHVLDWVMFSRKHKDEIDWKEFDARIDEFGFRKFYEVFNGIGQDAFGNTCNSQLSTDSQHSTLNSKIKSLMLNDIWAPLDLHETLHGMKGKLGLASNTWRARWKYRYFSPISMPKALWIQAMGFLFDKNPTLN